jgi:hypothetical protein
MNYLMIVLKVTYKCEKVEISEALFVIETPIVGNYPLSLSSVISVTLMESKL